MQISTPQKVARRSFALGLPAIALRLVRSWFRSVVARGERQAYACLVSVGMSFEPGTFPGAVDLAGDQSRLVW